MFKYKCRFEALHGSVIVKPVRSLRYRSDQSPLESCTVKEVIVLVRLQPYPYSDARFCR